MNFQEQLAQKKAQIEENLPPDMLSVMHRSTKELVESGIYDNVLKVNDQSPSFELLDQQNKNHSLADYLQHGPLVITFYRGFWCPYCNIDLANFNHYKQQIENAGATMIAISPELQKYSKKIIQMQKLSFDILHDKDNTVAEQFGLKFELPENLINVYKELKINLKLYNGVDKWTLPMPARFVIDQLGIIRYAESSADYTMRPDPDQIVEVLKTL